MTLLRKSYHYRSLVGACITMRLSSGLHMRALSQSAFISAKYSRFWRSRMTMLKTEHVKMYLRFSQGVCVVVSAIVSIVAFEVMESPH